MRRHSSDGSAGCAPARSGKGDSSTSSIELSWALSFKAVEAKEPLPPPLTPGPL